MLTKDEINSNQLLPLGKLLGGITKSYFGALSKKLEPLGVDRHFSALVAIDHATCKCTQQYLSDLLNYDKVSMVRILDYLVDKKLITRSVNQSDRREHLINLTPKAKKIMDEIHNGIRDMNNLAFSGISKEDRLVFYTCITRIMKNIENLPAYKVDIQLKKK